VIEWCQHWAALATRLERKGEGKEVQTARVLFKLLLLNLLWSQQMGQVEFAMKSIATVPLCTTAQWATLQ